MAHRASETSRRSRTAIELIAIGNRAVEEVVAMSVFNASASLLLSGVCFRISGDQIGHETSASFVWPLPVVRHALSRRRN